MYAKDVNMLLTTTESALAILSAVNNIPDHHAILLKQNQQQYLVYTLRC